MPIIDDLKRLAVKVKQARLNKGWTQKDLALKSGLTAAYISNIETAYVNPDRGPVTPSDSSLQALASALGVPVSQFHAILGRADSFILSEDPRLSKLLFAFQNGSPAKQHLMMTLADFEAIEDLPSWPDGENQSDSTDSEKDK